MRWPSSVVVRSVLRVPPNSVCAGSDVLWSNHRSLEHFARWGCVDELRARRVMPTGYPIGGLVAYRDFESAYWHAPPGRERLARYFAETNERLPQYLTEAGLRGGAGTRRTGRPLYGSTGD